ncbi:ribosome biogenesis GTPase Der [Candidatus Peregrinibacteria bacterium CG10_big_fil_rev_8_21_14_0_10_36_19]|nr:MAG: ribosome biogenesis GTPase Der [Candidatus Peregrinibacteria bacterium CG10_big_fil_rev_8_21_14_0_10_36_19]
MDPAPIVAIVGRPNVGKSTLFNRLIGKKMAIIAEEAGTTRDRVMQKMDCHGYFINLVDTGGLEYGKKENIEEDIQSQSHVAIDGADVILFIVDVSAELTSNDFAAAEILRKSKKDIILVASKCDNQGFEDRIYNIYELGFGEPVKISAIHKLGIESLTHTIEDHLKKQGFKKGEQIKIEDQTNICILGKPNAGKSSLVNSLLGSEKVIVSDVPGTTRDSTDTEVVYKEKTYNLIDTAGLRKRGKIERGIEKFSALRCLMAIERSDIVILLIDGSKGLTSQDAHIVSYALEHNKGLIIGVNKIDLFEEGEETRDSITHRLQRKFSFIPWAPVIFLSAKNKKNIYNIFELADKIMAERRKRIPTPEFNSFLQKITFKHVPASARQKKPKFKYGSQVEIEPPTFLFFFKFANNLHFSYPRYLENEIRKEYGFQGTAIQLKFKNQTSENEQSLKTSQ